MWKHLMEDRFAYAPEGGSASATAEASADQRPTIPDKVVIDGEEIDVKEAIKDHKDKRAWQKAQTQRDQQLAERSRELDNIAAKIVDRISTPAATPSQQQEQRQAVVDDLEARMATLPDPVEDREGYNKGLARIIRESEQRAAEQARQQALEEAKTSNQQTANSSEARMQAELQSDRIVRENEAMVEAEVAESYPTLTAREKADLIDEISQLRGPKYTQPVKLPDGRVALRYNPQAVHAAARALELKPATKNSRSTTSDRRSEPAPLSEPGPNASAAEKAAFLRALPEAEMVRRLNSMSEADKEALGQVINRPPG